ncbi:probable N-acetyltransferase camello [Hyla sarda]|uniref:probable N-acetyltransferase camello n=1 Tax=Hyla sarda TaxID=327740 RepID=UPI0024C21E8C|nr:probable N-acetyltransferase camello [Hyla sarda]
MADFFIRPYESRDYDVVRALFAEGVMDYRPSTFMYLLRLRPIQVTVLVSFVALYLVFRSFLVSWLGLVALLALGYLCVIIAFQKIVTKAYNMDLQNIEESYTARPNSTFFVAESNGRVVGMVGVQPVQGSHREVELRRLCVAKDQRHKGIAKTLCWHVIDFARQRGFHHVTLNTSTIQHAAHKLYRNMGFRVTKSKPVSHPIGRYLNVTVTYYSYDIKS